MRRHLVQNLTLQTKSTTDSGLEDVVSWTSGSAYRLIVTPAGIREVERAQLQGEVVTHTAIAPRGLDLTVDDHRFTDGTTTYRIVEVTDTPKGTIVGLEAQT